MYVYFTYIDIYIISGFRDFFVDIFVPFGQLFLTKRVLKLFLKKFYDWSVNPFPWRDMP